jgi:hypothetical protein
MSWNRIGGPAHSLAVFGNHLAALTPDRQAVWMRDPTSGTWSKIGGPAAALVGGGFDLYAVTPGPGDLWRYDGISWSKVGGPGAQFVGICNAVYALTPDRAKCYRFDYSGSWTQIGGQAQAIIAGGSKVYAAAPNNAAISEWSRYFSQEWKEIGGPGSMWVGVGGTVYGLTPDKSAVYKYNGTPNSWTKIGGPADTLIGGGSCLYAIQPGTGDLWRYSGVGEQWDKVGSPGTGFVAVGRMIYGMTTDKSEVWEFNDDNTESHRLRGLFFNVYARPEFGNRVTRGFLVKQMGGDVLAEHCSDACFQPFSTLKLLPYLHTVIEVDKGNATLTESTVWWIQPTTGTPEEIAYATCLEASDPNTAINFGKLKDVLPTMMWESHNRSLDALLTNYGPANITITAQSLGLTQTEMYFGCPHGGKLQPFLDNISTLMDFARLFEGVEGLIFVTKETSRQVFRENMITFSAAPGTSYSSPITGRTSGPLSNEFLRPIVQREAGQAKQAIVNEFMKYVVIRGKGGSWGPDDAGNSEFLELTLPFKNQGVILPTKFVVGWYICQRRGVEMPFPPTADFYQYIGGTNWKKIGGPGAQFVASGDNVYALTPDKNFVYRYDRTSGTWSKIGGPAQSLIAGDAGVYAINPSNGDISHYTGTGQQWQRIGGPGSVFVSAGSTIYGLTPNQNAVFKYNGTPDNWTQVRGPAADLIGSGETVYAIESSTRDIYRYSGTPNQWQKIGGPGAQFVAWNNALFGLTSDKKAVYAYKGVPNNWTQIGSDAHSLAIYDGKLCALTPDRNATFMYSGSAMNWAQIGDAFASLVGGGNALYAAASITGPEKQKLETFQKEIHTTPIRLALQTW